MDKKVTGIVTYLTFIGLLLALLIGDREGAKFHINQSLVLVIAVIINAIIGRIPFIGWFVSTVFGIFLFVCFIIGIIGASQGQEKEIPLLGSIKILK